MSARGLLQLYSERGEKSRIESATYECIPGGRCRAFPGDMISGVSKYYVIAAILQTRRDLGIALARGLLRGNWEAGGIMRVSAEKI